MAPERPRPSLDGVRPAQPRQPDYRPNHELSAPPRQKLITAHEPEIATLQPPVVSPEPGPSTKVSAASLDDIENPTKPKKSRKKLFVMVVVASIVFVILAVIAAAIVWYQHELSPVTSDTSKHIRVTIATGSTPSAIAALLANDGVIRSQQAFSIYTKLTGAENNLKAGLYDLQPSMSTPTIVDHLVSGKQDTFDVTFLPGNTITANRQALIDLGFSAADVDAALKQTYDSPLFATKPASTNLEGYFYGQTNKFDTSASVQSILKLFFSQYSDFITKNNIVADFQKQGLTLYQGITLASIVQREVTNSDPETPSDDQRQVARVFLNRLAAGMTLGSDITAYYGADMIGAAHSVSVDTPYNTRIHTGLPPGPISTPSDAALRAVANPASNNYLFFLSGDDGITYFATTDAQHQQNIIQHCQKKCAVN